MSTATMGVAALTQAIKEEHAFGQVAVEGRGRFDDAPPDPVTGISTWWRARPP